jgi:glutamate-5-semialdehyde dehydrogenase
MSETGKKAKAASKRLARASSEAKNKTLQWLADRLINCQAEVLAANAKDIAAGQEAGLTPALIDRLTLTEKRLQGIADDLRSLVELNDPIGEIFDEKV